MMARRRAWIGTYTIAGTKELRARLVRRLRYPGGRKARSAAKRLCRDFTPKRARHTEEWATWFERAPVHVADDILPGRPVTTRELRPQHAHLPGIRVSTVFLALDHNHYARIFGGDATPILFETMIFGGPHDGYQERYCSWTEAEVGHRRALLLARNTSGKLS